MVRLVNLEEGTSFSGRIFWDMVRPGVRLRVHGPLGCVTSELREVEEQIDGSYLLRTRNSRYLLKREGSPAALPSEMSA